MADLMIIPNPAENRIWQSANIEDALPAELAFVV